MAGQADKDKGLAQVAERLNYLFVHRHPQQRDAYSVAEVAAGTGISDTAIRQLRRGEKTNPTIDTLLRIASFFDVPPTYWVTDEAPEALFAKRDLQSAMENAGVKSIALRSEGLSPENMRLVTGMIDMARKSQGLPEIPSE
ncbi:MULTISPECIES: helix-turn-helix transcriptional regulator [unclassified Kitasatospora]|uniref:helix-turn-helix domain-containing protein n=1 Tax=unclassified Kitasatospora TaxID=2633591 RepID=UPI000709A2CF|nr:MULTISPECIES: helix-turn-helix transcriptional regulator [unclassified Kitasatospora]KQV20891.1 hypothetical protein ASC99_20515 [Kitasatospora sp. Root107]KRB60455.1 hypothetical protein ASE03_12665 [Kitasatospora sp. Root187]